MLWFFEPLELYDTYANRHPTSYLHRRLTDEYLCMNFQIQCAEADSANGTPDEPVIHAGLLVHGQVAAHSYASSARVAKCKASKAALAVLEGMTLEEFRRRFGCDCRRSRCGDGV